MYKGARCSEGVNELDCSSYYRTKIDLEARLACSCSTLCKINIITYTRSTNASKGLALTRLFAIVAMSMFEAIHKKFYSKCVKEMFHS